jgi:long-subunit acyl-CoA synthetase (AMP-forming)
VGSIQLLQTISIQFFKSSNLKCVNKIHLKMLRIVKSYIVSKSQKDIIIRIIRTISTTHKLNQSERIVRSPHPSIDYPKNSSIHQYVWGNLEHWSHKTALVDGITNRSIKYGQLRDQCRVLAIRLQSSFQLDFGDTIAVCLPNSIDFPLITLAGNEAGVIVTTINPIYTAGKEFLNFIME